MADNIDLPATGKCATDKVTYSGDANTDVQLVRQVGVAGAEGSKTVLNPPLDETLGLGVGPRAYSGGNYWPNAFFQREVNPTAWTAAVLHADAAGNLAIRGPVTTDEASFRDDFTGSALTTAVGGNITTNATTTITGSNFLTNGVIKRGHYIKVDSHAESAWVRVVKVNSDTALTVASAYSGASTTAAGSVQSYGQNTGSGGSFSVSSSALTIASGTTISATTYVYRVLDFGSFMLTGALSLSQRIANQTAYLGVQKELTAPTQYVRFAFDGTSNTAVKCQSAFSSSAADIEETSVTLPNAGTTAATHYFKIEKRPDRALFWIDDILVAVHKLHLPDPDTSFYVWAGWVNGGSAPATSTNYVLDALAVDSFNLLRRDHSNPTPVAAECRHDDVDRDGPVKVGGRAVTALSADTMVSAGDRCDLRTDLDGALIVRPDAPMGDMLYERLSDTSGNATNSTVFGATSGARNVIEYIVVYNDSTTNGFVDFLDGSSPGTILLTLPLPAKGGAVFQPPRPLRQPTANNAFRFDVSAALTTVYISMGGYKSKA